MFFQKQPQFFSYLCARKTGTFTVKHLKNSTLHFILPLYEERGASPCTPTHSSDNQLVTNYLQCTGFRLAPEAGCRIARPALCRFASLRGTKQSRPSLDGNGWPGLLRRASSQRREAREGAKPRRDWLRRMQSISLRERSCYMFCRMRRQEALRATYYSSRRPLTTTNPPFPKGTSPSK